MAPPKAVPARRYRHELDNMRGFLTAIVVFQHTAAAYCGIGGRPPHSTLFDKSSPILMPILAVHQSFMGLFFWLSGHMTAQSLARSKDGEFVRSKLWRLGIPILLYSTFLDPLQSIILRPREDLRSNIKAYFNAVRNYRGFGVTWYTASLLTFDLCAVLFRRCFNLWSKGRTKPSNLAMLAKSYALLVRWGWLAVATGSFLISTKFPPGVPVPIIHIQPSYVLQHIHGYVLGHMAFHLGKHRITGLFDKESQQKVSMAKALAISLGTMPIVFLPAFLKNKRIESTKKTDLASDSVKDLDMDLGGWTWTAAIYATWNEISFSAIAPAVMSVFEQNFNQPGKWKLFSPRYSYAAYLLHSPVSWVADSGVDTLLTPQGKTPPWMASKIWTACGPVLMTGTMSLIDTAASFGVGKLLIDYVPGVGTML